MPDLQLKPRESAAERCPYCHDCLEGGEIEDSRIVCEGCGTSHHQACFAELGGCTLMGCPGGRAQPVGALEEIRARIRTRVGRFVARNAKPPQPGARERLAAHWVCEDCGIEFADRSCLFCAGVLEASCEGTRRHCADCDRAFVQTWGGVQLEPNEEDRAKARKERDQLGVVLAAILLGFVLLLLGLTP